MGFWCFACEKYHLKLDDCPYFQKDDDSFPSKQKKQGYVNTSTDVA